MWFLCILDFLSEPQILICSISVGSLTQYKIILVFNVGGICLWTGVKQSSRHNEEPPIVIFFKTCVWYIILSYFQDIFFRQFYSIHNMKKWGEIMPSLSFWPPHFFLLQFFFPRHVCWPTAWHNIYVWSCFGLWFYYCYQWCYSHYVDHYIYAMLCMEIFWSFCTKIHGAVSVSELSHICCNKFVQP